jgi:hypothetical protein
MMEKIIALSICFVIATFASCTGAINYHDNIIMDNMVKNGSEPIAARCAIKGLSYNACAVYIANKKYQ